MYLLLTYRWRQSTKKGRCLTVKTGTDLVELIALHWSQVEVWLSKVCLALVFQQLKYFMRKAPAKFHLVSVVLCSCKQWQITPLLPRKYFLETFKIPFKTVRTSVPDALFGRLLEKLRLLVVTAWLSVQIYCWTLLIHLLLWQHWF